MTHKMLRMAGIALIVIGVSCNQWMLSLVFPEEGFHIAGILEKSQGVWGLASEIFIWTVEVLCVGLGLIALRYYKTPRKIIFAISMIAASSIVSFVVLESLVRLISPPNMFSPYYLFGLTIKWSFMSTSAVFHRLHLIPRTNGGYGETNLRNTGTISLRSLSSAEVPRNVIILMTTRRGHIFSRKK